MAQKHVLVADDDDMWLRELKRTLEQLGSVVDTARSYIGVRNFIDNKDNRYILIVCDNNMPIGGPTRPHRTSGLELLAHAKSAGLLDNTTFVLHTSDDSKDTLRLVAEFGGVFRRKHDTSSDIGGFLAGLLSKAAA